MRFIVVILLTLVSSVAMSEPLDLATKSCVDYMNTIADLSEKSPPAASAILSFVYGFAASKGSSTALDPAEFRSFSAAIQQYCVANPENPLLQAVESITIQAAHR
jgi:hypothetical protein